MTSFVDAHLIAADSALRTLFAPHRAGRACPTVPDALQADAARPLSEAEKRQAGALMRVNHVGEICAQALYTSQALAARLGPGNRAAREKLARHLEAAGQEETDHLAWCKQRLDELGDRKLTLQETSLRRILQKRFDKVFKDLVEIEPLPLEGELASAGPLPMNELTARKDGWVVAGWRKRDAGAFVPAEVVLSERFVEATRATGEGIVRRVAAKVAERIDAAAD